MLARILRRIFGSSQTGGFSFGLILLAYQLLARVGVNRIRLVTGTAIALQVSVFLGWVKLGPLGSIVALSGTTRPTDVCLDAASLVKQSPEYWRLWTAPLTHGSDLHLYYNMLSLAWKGYKLESHHGSVVFLLLLTLFTFSSGLIYVLLSILAADILEDQSYMHQCTVGFSSVLFALKVLMHRLDEGSSEEDFGFFTLPKHLAIWAELAIIQLIVPNASLLGHLAGILTGLIYVNLGLPFRLVSAPFKTSLPSTFALAGIASALHFDLVQKPWRTAFFWTSKSSLVCLNSNSVLGKGQWIRLISGPLEHHGTVHFLLCIASFILKGRFLESMTTQPHPSFLSRTVKTAVMTVATSLVYVLSSQVAEDLLGIRQSPECVQGLSGLNFALKVSVIYAWFKAGKLGTYPYIIFEMAECMMLFEDRTLLFHLSGLAVGLFAATLSSPKEFLASRFPGRGQRLGRGSGTNRLPASAGPLADVTRSWGYAGQEARFRSGGTWTAHSSAHSGQPQAVSGGSDLSNRPDTSSIDDEDQEDGESDKSHSQSPVYSSQPPRPSTSAASRRGPAPRPSYFSELANPPPPPPGGGTRLLQSSPPLSSSPQLSDQEGSEETEEDDEQTTLDQIDRSPSNPQMRT